MSANEVATDPSKIAAVKEWQTPSDVKRLQAFLGTTGIIGNILRIML